MSNQTMEPLKALLKNDEAPEIKVHVVSPVQTLVVQYASSNSERPQFESDEVK